MIYITTGTIDRPFYRLIQAGIKLSHHVTDEIVIQTGKYQPSPTMPTTVTLTPYFSHSQALKYYRHARLVIMASGEGSILHALMVVKHKPLLFPRLPNYHEHVNHQQLEIAQAVCQQHLALMATTEDDLIETAIQLWKKPISQPKYILQPSPSLINGLITTTEQLHQSHDS